MHKGYIGTTARLLPITYIISESVQRQNRYEIQEAAAATYAFVRSAAFANRRTWDLEIIADSPTLGAVTAFYEGAYGSGPFLFIPETAALTNLLTPAQSLLAGVSNGGPVTTADGGHAPASLVGGAMAVLADKVPALPGKPFTVSVDASGASELIVQPRTITGANAGGAKVVKAKGELMQRIHAVIPLMPATARYVTISARGYNQLAQLQVRLARGSAKWAPGAGASSVVLGDLTTSPLVFDESSGELWGSLSLKIKEVG